MWHQQHGEMTKTAVCFRHRSNKLRPTGEKKNDIESIYILGHGGGGSVRGPQDLKKKICGGSGTPKF